ncbi:hypothetical protein DEO72_LG8g1981 [Vigna unguiculata]|uniref:Uncharacterized protein n=1 Tax=Vigna unguiculata TaxID=3917 RepID=A0A4D6MV18_VIGUN|nr:hypothetical protein DEO72_LG8g1981 [Vigna unguiculata]
MPYVFSRARSSSHLHRTCSSAAIFRELSRNHEPALVCVTIADVRQLHLLCTRYASNHGSTTSHGRASSLHQRAPDRRRRTTASATLPANQNSTITAAMAAIAPPPSSLAGEGGAALSAAPLQHTQASMKP